jgi:hypothetical protein
MRHSTLHYTLKANVMDKLGHTSQPFKINLKTIKINTDKVNLAPKHLRIWGVEVDFHAFLTSGSGTPAIHPEQRPVVLDKRLNGSPGCFRRAGKEIPMSQPGLEIIITFGVRIGFNSETLRTGRSTEHSSSPVLLQTASVGNEVAFFFACDTRYLCSALRVKGQVQTPLQTKW